MHISQQKSINLKRKKKQKQKKGNKLIKKDTFVIYSEFFLPVKEGSS